MTMTCLQVRDICLNYQYQPGPAGAPVIVFSNSLGTDYRIWDRVRARLAGSYGLLVYDKRGHGLSSTPADMGGIADHAGDLVGLMDGLGIDRAVICGLSVGGMIAQRVAIDHPGRVAGLILCDTAPKIGTPESWAARIDAVSANGLSSITAGVMERWFTAPFRDTNPAFPLYVAMFQRQDAAGYLGTCAAIRDADMTDAVGRIGVPTLCVVGDQDLSTPPALVEAMAKAIPGAGFAVIDGCGHLPPVEQPEALLALIQPFLAGLGRSPVDRFSQGMATRRKILGDAHVDRAEAAKTAFDEPFQTLITEAAWGHLWSRPHWTPRERSMVTLALLAALNHHDEVAMHVRATANTGATPEDIREALLHVAIYAGVPAANHAIKIARQALAGMNGENGA